MRGEIMQWLVSECNEFMMRIDIEIYVKGATLERTRVLNINMNLRVAKISYVGISGCQR